MSAQTQAAPAMNLFERYLSVWVALCIAIGILVGQVMPGDSRVIGG
ncbi:arsenical-resistance protein, partial [Salmonella enterica subsp. enterica serovar Typhimurium]|nr:arsenical-resistance protein [Salmonella enterica subsp. enterica serovar Typhimurium]